MQRHSCVRAAPIICAVLCAPGCTPQRTAAETEAAAAAAAAKEAERGARVREEYEAAVPDEIKERVDEVVARELVRAFVVGEVRAAQCKHTACRRGHRR